MAERGNSKLSLFLMELIVAIMFFSLSAAVCVRLFVGAHIMSENTEDLNNATIWTQNLAEAFTGANGNLQKISELFPGAYVTSDSEDAEEGTLILFFDDKWELLDEQPSGAAYEALLVITKEEAQEVYSDVNTYGVTLEGKSAVGKIGVMNTSASTDIVSVIPEDEASMILLTTVDVYLGKEGE